MQKNSVFQRIGKTLGLACGGLALAAGNAAAALDLSTTTLDVAPVEAAAGIVITAILGVWVCRKVYVFFKKS